MLACARASQPDIIPTYSKMKILFAETGHMQHQDEVLDYSPFAAVGDLELADIRMAEDLVKKGSLAEVLVIGRLPLSRADLTAFPNLRLIVKAGTGVDKIDLIAARERNIPVMNLSGYGALPVAQATMAFILAFAGSLIQYDRDVKNSRWRDVQFTHPMSILSGKRLGIIGLGGISRRVIELSKCFGFHIQLYTRHPDPKLNVAYVDIQTLAKTSDFITVHCSLDSHTRGLIDADFLSLVKRTVYIINTARPAVIDEKAVVSALRENRIAGLALDGFWTEPPSKEHELFGYSNVLITPHVSWAPLETRQSMINEMAALIRDYKAGTLRNVVN
jgi:glycerate dehydrogenase